MGKVGRVVLGVASVVGGVAVGVFTGNWSLGLAMVSFGASRLFQPRIDAGTGASEERQGAILENRVGGTQPLPVVYGTTKIAGIIADIRVDSDSTDRKLLAVVMAFCHGSRDGGDIEGVDEIWFDDRLAIDGTAIQSPFSGIPVGNGGRKYLEFATYGGDIDQTVDSRLSELFPSEWPSTSEGAGVAYSRFELFYDAGVYQGGIPTIQAVIKGNRVFDPRDSTWKHSDNPALCIRDFLLSPVYGLKLEEDQLDEDSFIEAANYCDELVTDPDGGFGAQMKRFTLNGWIDTGQEVMSNLALLLTSCRGMVVNEGDTWRMLIRNQRTTSDLFVINGDNTVADSWTFVLAGMRDVPNIARATYVDPDRGYQVDQVEWPEPGDSNGYLSEDNDVEHRMDIDLPFTDTRARAQQIAMTLLKEARQDVGATVVLKESALKVRVGDLVEVWQETPGWEGKIFDVLATRLRTDGLVEAILVEYDPDVYDLDTQGTTPTVPGTSLPDPFEIDAPTGLTAESGDTTVLLTQGGALIPRILLSWTPPSDPFLDKYEAQIKLASEDTWRAAGIGVAGDTELYIAGVVEGDTYDIQLRAVNVLGVPSSWTQVINHTVGLHTLLPLPQNINDTVHAINGDYEAGLSYWAVNGGDADDISIEETLVDGGTKALRITKSGASSRDVYQVADARDVAKNSVADKLLLRVQEGDEIRLRGRYRTDGTISARAGIEQLDADKAHVSWQITALTAGSSYASFEDSYVVPAGIAYVAIFLSTTTASTTGFVLFDNIVIERMIDAPSVTDPFDLTLHEIIADTGTIGGWTLSDSELSSGSVKIQASAERILMGAATAPLTGVGIFMGKDGSDYEFRAGDPSGDYIHWDGFSLTIVGELNAETGEIGGWTIGATSLKAGSGATTVGLDSGGTNPAIYAGSATPGSAPFRVTQAGALTATSGSVGGWTLASGQLSAGSVTISATNERILFGSATAPQTGVGVFIGKDGSDYEFRVGNPAGQYLHWTGSVLSLSGEIIQSTNLSGTTKSAWEALVRRALQGAHNILFGGDFEDNLDFFTNPTGVSRVVDSTKAHTGNAYLQLASTASTGSNPASDQKDDLGATKWFPVNEGDVVKLGGWVYRESGGKPVQFVVGAVDKDKGSENFTTVASYDGANGVWTEISGTYTIPAGKKYIRYRMQIRDTSDATATTVRFDDCYLKILTQAGDILANTITATEIGSLVFTGKTANFDQGSVGGWILASGDLSSGSVTISADDEQILLGLATAPLTGIGIFLGKDGSDYEFRVGDPSGDYIHWDGDTLTVGGTITAESFTAANPVFEGTLTIEASEGGSRHKFDAQSSGGRYLIFDETGTSIAQFTASGGDLLVQVSGGGNIRLIDTHDGAEVFIGGGGVRLFPNTEPVSVRSPNDDALAIIHDSATGNPMLSFVQGGGIGRVSYIQHVDTNDVLLIAAEYGRISFAPGSGGTETERARFNNAAPFFHVFGNADEHLRIEHTSATGNPLITFYQNGNRRSYIQHLDSSDVFVIASHYGPINFAPGSGGTESTIALFWNSKIELAVPVSIGTSLGDGAQIVAIYSATFSWDIGSTSAHASATTTATVTGAQTNDIVIVEPLTNSSAPFHYKGYVSAADTITIIAYNSGSAVADPPSQSFRAIVIRFA